MGDPPPEPEDDPEGVDAPDEADPADTPGEGDVSEGADDPTDTPEEDEPADAPGGDDGPEDGPTDESGEEFGAPPGGSEDADSFGEPPESAFDAGDDWSAAMGDDASATEDEEDTAAAGETYVEPTLGGGNDGPASDEEMPLAVHIEEMIRRLAIVLGVAGVVTLVAYPASEFLIEYLWQSYIPQPDVNRPHVYGPLEFVLTKLKVAGLSGTIVGLPVFVYETYRFMKPGLYPTERRYYLASVPTSLLLAFVGVAFSHFVILPLTVLYFTSYTESAAIVAFGLRETFNLIVLMMGYMAIIFQIPLFVMLAIMMGLVTREWMEDKRILFWGGFGGLAFTFVTVDPTGMAPIIIAVTMIVLFEGTLALLRWTGN